MKRYFLLLMIPILFIVASCDKDTTMTQSTETPSEDPDPVLYSTKGTAQKGPFVMGSDVTFYELDDNLSQTGVSHTTQTTDDLGSFSIDESIGSQYVEIVITGFYYDEVTGAISSSEITLSSISDISSDNVTNVNVLTAMASEKIKTLVQEGQTYEDAVSEAETGVLAVFNISSEATDVTFDQMDFTSSGESNAVLLLASATLLSTTEDITTIITQITSDINNYGELTNQTTIEAITSALESLDTEQITENLYNYYSELGVVVDIPDMDGIIANQDDLVAADRAALIAFYNSTNGDSWTNNTNWCSNEPLSEWYGVTVDDSGRVTKLYFYKNALSGEIPAEIGNLTNLTELTLWGNSITGEIPKEIGNLTNLTELTLCTNSLTGEIPTEIGNLTNLKTLDISINDLTGEIPNEIGNLTNLVGLQLELNTLTGEIPKEIGNLDNVWVLTLNNNNLSGEIPAEIGNMSNLTNLHLYTNNLSGEIPAEIGDLSNLTHLYLYTNNLSGELPAEIGNISNLKYLDLSTNNLSGEIPSEIGNLTNLSVLYLYNNRLEGKIPQAVFDLPNWDSFDADVNIYPQQDGYELLYPYKLNDIYYNGDEAIGIVYAVSDDGYSGKIVSLTQMFTTPNSDPDINVPDLTDVKKWAEELSEESGLDWELPTLYDLRELFLGRCGLKADNYTVFFNTPLSSWTSGPFPDAGDYEDERVAFNQARIAAGGSTIPARLMCTTTTGTDYVGMTHFVTVYSSDGDTDADFVNGDFVIYAEF